MARPAGGSGRGRPGLSPRRTGPGGPASMPSGGRAASTAPGRAGGDRWRPGGARRRPGGARRLHDGRRHPGGLGGIRGARGLLDRCSCAVDPPGADRARLTRSRVAQPRLRDGGSSAVDATGADGRPRACQRRLDLVHAPSKPCGSSPRLKIRHDGVRPSPPTDGSGARTPRSGPFPFTWGGPPSPREPDDRRDDVPAGVRGRDAAGEPPAPHGTTVAARRQGGQPPQAGGRAASHVRRTQASTHRDRPAGAGGWV